MDRLTLFTTLGYIVSGITVIMGIFIMKKEILKKKLTESIGETWYKIFINSYKVIHLILMICFLILYFYK